MFKKFVNFVSGTGNEDVDEDIDGFETQRKSKISDRSKSISLTIGKLFERYHQISKKKGGSGVAKDEIREDGLMQFSSDLDVEPEDSVFLVLFAKFECKEQYVLKKTEFVNGFKKLNLNNLEEIRNAVPNLRKELKDEKSFEQIYQFSFQYHQTNYQVDVELATLLWNTLFSSSYIEYKRVDVWYKFCKEHFAIKDVSKDNWAEGLEILREVGKIKDLYKNEYKNLLEGSLSSKKLFKSYFDYLENKNLWKAEKKE